MGRRFFNSEVGIWRFFGWVGEIVMLRLLWVLCSVPFITMGASSTALYDTVSHVTRRKENDLFSRFFGTFRRELKTACLTTLLWAAVTAVLLFLYRAVANTGQDGKVISGISMLFLILLYFLLCVLSWVFPLLSRFTFRFSDLNRTALHIALGNILRSALMALLFGAGIALILRNYLAVFFVPGLTAWLSSFLIEPVFEKYTDISPAD